MPIKVSSQLNTIEIKNFQSCFETVLFQPKQNALAVKRFSCISQLQSLSVVCAPSQRLGAER